MKVILQKDIKNVGKVGEVVNVATGYARNFLFPRNLAVIALEKSVKAWQHLQKVAELKKKKALVERKALLEKLSGTTLNFKMSAGEKDKIFGSVTAHDISHALEEKGFSVDRRDIRMELVKALGQHKAEVDFGGGLITEIVIVVEKG